MAGFPRSGSTLLTSLLSQNPDIHASHQTHLQPSVKAFVQNSPSYESVKSGYREDVYQQVVSGMAQSFFEDIEKPIIIDKNRDWSTYYSFNLAKLITDDVKIIFPVRPVLEILASFIKLCHNNSGNYIDINMQNDDFWAYYFRPVDDARCDWLMRANSQMEVAMFGYMMSQKDEFKNNFHLVEYSDLCSNPQGELDKIYDFLGYERYAHQFENIVNKEPLNDAFVFGVPSLHHVRSKISVVSPKPESILSEYVIQKYGNSLTSLMSK